MQLQVSDSSVYDFSMFCHFYKCLRQDDWHEFKEHQAETEINDRQFVSRGAVTTAADCGK